MSAFKNQYFLPAHKQRGAALMLLLLLVGVGALAVFVSGLNRATHQLERDRITNEALARAKDAAIGFAVTNQSMPGGLPYPDRRSDGNYDGNGDCVTSPVNNSYLLGRFPSGQEQGCGSSITAFGLVLQDADGEKLWYAVSKNLVKNSSGSFSPITTDSIMTGSSDWLELHDQTGALVSGEIAFIVLAAGGVLQGQNRLELLPPALPPTVQNYLDSFTVAATVYSNSDTTGTVLDFISAPLVNNTTNRFNDKLVYMTKKVFATRVAGRVAGEIRARLTDPYPVTWTAFKASASPVLPAWFIDWDSVVTYDKGDPTVNMVTIGFSGCPLLVFTIKWNSTISQSQMYQAGSC